MFRNLLVVTLVCLHAIRPCRAYQHDSKMDIRYCLENNLNTITCNLDSQGDVSTKSSPSSQVSLSRKRVLEDSSVLFGIHHDVPISSLGSFKVCIDRPYSYPLSPAQLLACATNPDQMVVVGAKSSASASTLSVMAVARAADAFRPTYSRTVAYYANGAYWYNLNTSSKSFGFSDVSAVNLQPSDAMCSGYGGNGQGAGTGPCQGSCENKLSWHVGYGGWRAGCTDFLNENTVWRKVVYILVSGGSFCPLGSYCPSGSDSALPCPVGTYCDESGLTAPKPCDRGAYCPIRGMSSPRPCPVGNVCPHTGMSAPMPCSPGSFCPTRGLSNSTLCTAGTFSSMAGASSCYPCRSCSAEHYRAQCGGRKAGTCFKCDTCSAGYFRVSCGGTAAVTSPGDCFKCPSCPAGKFRMGCRDSSPGDCVPCRTCPAGKALQGCGGASSGTCIVEP